MEKEKTKKFKELAKIFIEYWEKNPDVPLELLRAAYLHMVEYDLTKEFAKNILPLLSPPKVTDDKDTNYTWNT